MGLRIKSSRKFKLGHNLATLMAVFALVFQPVSGFVAGQLASAAPVTQVVYDSSVIQTSTTNFSSTGIQSHSSATTQYNEFGDRVILAGNARILETVSFALSSWPIQAGANSVSWCESNAGKCTDRGFLYPMTLGVYSGTDASKIDSFTQEVFIPWRPAGDESCPVATGAPHLGWLQGGECYNHGGIISYAAFNVAGEGLIVPNDVIFSVSWNTRNYGYEPTGVAGPIDAVNLAWRNSSTHGVSVGTDQNAGQMYMQNNSSAFRAVDWGTPFNTAMRVTATTDAAAPTVRVNLNRESFVNTGAWVNQSTNPEIQANDENGLSRIELFKEGSSAPSHVWNANGDKNRRANISFLGDGKYTIVAHDISGNASQPFVINLDKTDPTTTLVVPTGLAGNVFTVSGVAEDNMALNRVFVQLVHRDTGVRYGGTTINLIPNGQGPAAWSKEYNATSLGLPEGDYAAHVQAVDMAGNRYDNGWSANFTLDKTAPNSPVLSVKAEANGAALTSGGFTNRYDIVTSWDKPDGDPVRYLYTYWNNIDGNKWKDDNRYELSRTSLSARGSFTEGEGTHYLQVFAFDEAGNKSASDVFEITYDKTPPQAVITAPTGEVDITKPFTISGTYSDSLSGVGRLHLYVSANEQTISQPFIVPDSQLNSTNGTFTYTLTQDDLDRLATSSLNLVSGDEFTVRANVFDRANNWANFEQQFNVVDPVVTGDYFTVHADHLGVGFSIDRFIGATKVEVELFDADNNPIAKNTGETAAMKNTLNSYSGQLSSPFYIPGQANDLFWNFGAADWRSVTPAYAVVTVFYGDNKQISSDRIDFVDTNTDRPLENYAALISTLPVLPAKEAGLKEVPAGNNGGPDESSTARGGGDDSTGDDTVALGVTPLANTFGRPAGGIPGILGASDNFFGTAANPAVANQANDDGAESVDVLGETTEADEGEIQGSLLDDTEVEEGCASFLGLCWYWWVLIVVAVITAAVLIRRAISTNESEHPRGL